MEPPTPKKYRKCRICHQSRGAPLVKPCQCKGSVGYVHPKCIIRWMASQKTIECSVCNHVIAASMVYDGQGTPLENASSGTVFAMASKYLFFKGVSWGGRIIFFIIIWLTMYPLLSSLCYTACMGYPHLFANSVRTRVHSVLPTTFTVDDTGDILIGLFSFWLVGMLLQLLFVPLVLGALMWGRFCMDNQAAIPALQFDEPAPPQPEEEAPQNLEADPIAPEDAEANKNEEDEENKDGAAEDGASAKEPHGDEEAKLPSDSENDQSDNLDVSDSSNEEDLNNLLEAAKKRLREMDNDNQEEGQAASLYTATIGNPSPREPSTSPRLVELKDKAAIIAALRSANQSQNEENPPEDEFFASVLGFTGDYIFSIGIFVAMVVILLGFLGLLSIPVYITGRCSSALATIVSRTVVIPASAIDRASAMSEVWVAWISHTLVSTSTLSAVLDRCLILASIISNNMFGFESNTVFSATHKASPKGEISAIASVLVWMFGINLASKGTMMIGRRVLPLKVQPTLLGVVTFVNGVLGKVMHLFIATFTASVLVATILSDVYVGTAPDGSLIVTPEHAFNVVGGPVRLPLCYPSVGMSEGVNASFTGTIAALRILQTNPLPKNTCGNYFDFGNCSHEQLQSDTVRMYMSHCGAFEDQQEEDLPLSNVVKAMDSNSDISITTLWSNTVHPDQSSHPFKGLLDPFTVAVISRDISVGRHVFSTLMLGYTSTTFTFAIITFLQECIHTKYFRWIFPVPPHGSQAEFLLTNPCRSQLFPLLKTILIIIAVQALFVRTSAHILMEMFWSADLFPFIMNDTQFLGIGATLFFATFIADPLLRQCQRAFEQLIKLFDLQQYVVLGEWPEGDFVLELYTRVTLLCGTLALMLLAVLTTIGAAVASIHLIVSVGFGSASGVKFRKELQLLASQLLSQVYYHMGSTTATATASDLRPESFSNCTLIEATRFKSGNVDNQWPPQLYTSAPQASGVTATYISLKATHALSPFLWSATLAVWIISMHPLWAAVYHFIQDIRIRIIPAWQERLKAVGISKWFGHVVLQVRLYQTAATATLRVVQVTRSTGERQLVGVERIQFKSDTNTRDFEVLKAVLEARASESPDTDGKYDCLVDDGLLSEIEAALPLQFGQALLVLLLCIVEVIAIPVACGKWWYAVPHIMHALYFHIFWKDITDALQRKASLPKMLITAIQTSLNRQLAINNHVPALLAFLGGPLYFLTPMINFNKEIVALIHMMHTASIQPRDQQVLRHESNTNIQNVLKQFATRYFNEKHCQGILIHDAPLDTI